MTISQDYKQVHKDTRTLCQKIKEESKKIRDGVKSNGVCLDKAFNLNLDPNGKAKCPQD